MMHEYTDGTFGPIQPASVALEEALNPLENGKVLKAIHFGAEDELQKKREESETNRHMESRIDELSGRLDEIEMKNRSPLHIPTGAEIDAIIKKSRKKGRWMG